MSLRFIKGTMKKSHLISLFLCLVLSILCREFYKQDFSLQVLCFLVVTSLAYFFPVILTLSVSESIFHKMNSSIGRVALYIGLLLLPYFIGILVDDRICLRPGLNFLFLGGWFSVAFACQRFAKYRPILIFILILDIWLAFEWDRFVLWQGSLYFLNVLLGMDLVILFFPILIRFRPFVMQFKWSYLWSKPLHQYSIVFLMLAVPCWILSGFLQLKATVDPLQIPIQFLAIFFFNALPEEILFRGLLQKQCEQYVGEYWSLILVSVVFGFAHLNNFPMWDYRFVIISFVAVLCFGMVFRRTHSMIPAALLHTIVNTTNEILFDKVPLI